MYHHIIDEAVSSIVSAWGAQSSYAPMSKARKVAEIRGSGS
jgi:hypothetical protein